MAKKEKEEKKEKKAKKEATYSSKTELHDTHKHLFGTGNNSDFIINMSVEGTHKLCGIYSIIAMLLVAISAIPYYISKAVGIGDTYMMLRTEDNETLAFLIMTLLVATGFLGLLIFMIACVKKEIVLNQNKSLWLFGAILVSVLISTLAADDIGTAFFGYLDRAEGFITIVGYIGFFAIGMTLTSAKYRAYASNTIVGIGTINAIMGILQSIPALSDYIPSYYNYLFIDFKTNIDRAEYFNAYAGYDASYAADGLCCSPFALAALLTVACAFAINNAAYTKKTHARIINLIYAGLMSGAAIVTQTFTAMLGVGTVIIVSVVIAAVKYSKAKKSEEKEEAKYHATKASVISSILAAVTAVGIFAGVVLTDNFRLRNERIIYTDSFERLAISYGAHSDHEGDGIFPTLWYEGIMTIKENLLLGVGPDNWSTMYNSGDGMETDRTYNEYLDIVLTRGLLGGALQLAMLIITLTKAVRMLKQHIGGEFEAAAIGAFTAFIAYAVQAFFNISTASSTPFFYLTIGIIWAYEAKGRRVAPTNK